MSNEVKQKIGLEVHIQLQGKKLFCTCATESSYELEKVVERNLRLSSGETGKFDQAAMYETQRSRGFIYHLHGNNCLVDVDEEPPHNVNSNALKRSIALSMSLNCSIVDYATFMRKIVIDGSNTTGFQRTAIIGFGGSVETSRGKVRISTVCLEEDAARKLSDNVGAATYSLERLGVPLVEISTEPDIVNAAHAIETAEKIGKLALLSGWARKGAEAIRQDVNFSSGFGRVEIKGVQKISLIESCLNYESRRHSTLAEISPKIKSGFNPERIQFIDVTEIFKDTKSKVILSGLHSGSKVYATVLTAMKGYLKNGNYRLGAEIADVTRLYGAGGIMHSDELPGYGVEKEIAPIISILKPNKDDAFAILVCGEEKIQVITKEIRSRISRILNLDLSETRFVDDNGSTHYLRPLPGRERMYPETDVAVVPIGNDILEQCKKIIPKDEEEMVASLTEAYAISRQDAASIINKGLTGSFEKLAELTGDARLSSRILNQLFHEILKKTSSRVLPDVLVDAAETCLSVGIVPSGLEKALLRHFVDGVSFINLSLMPDLQTLSHDELEKIIKDLIRDENSVTMANLIPRIKARENRIFDPKDAINIFKELSQK
ncbi:MAG: Glu-tRNA(Gln) amidotransferase subunit GatE [Thermoplasmatales archaeon]|nr:Glu-tRNA(Gln) amidotransferase subunit GatE [Thermoplasmatales archaeon]MCW6169676.1 Glu-tRNA(Gln) amidotransferase subunit GatE [Thermoplasmatales archaeon]